MKAQDKSLENLMATAQDILVNIDDFGILPRLSDLAEIIADVPCDVNFPLQHSGAIVSVVNKLMESDNFAYLNVAEKFARNFANKCVGRSPLERDIVGSWIDVIQKMSNLDVVLNDIVFRAKPLGHEEKRAPLRERIDTSPKVMERVGYTMSLLKTVIDDPQNNGHIRECAEINLDRIVRIYDLRKPSLPAEQRTCGSIAGLWFGSGQ